MQSLDESRRAIIACRVTGSHISADYWIVYYPDYQIRQFPAVSVESHRQGGVLPANGVLKDHWSLEILQRAQADWFLPFLQRMANGESVPLNEIERAYELQNGAPIHVLPPHARLDEEYCRRHFHVE